MNGSILVVGGAGYIGSARRVTGLPIPAQTQERRPGDPAVLVADSQKARRELGWEPRFGGLGTIVEHAWGWEMKKATVWRK